MTRVILLVLAVALMVGCAGREVRDHAVVAQEVQEDILALQEAIKDGADQDEIDRRFRVLVDKMDVLIDSAENYDEILRRFRVVYDQFDAVSGVNDKPDSDGDAFFADHGINIDSQLERAASARSSSAGNRDADLEPSNAELRAAAERNVADNLASLMARSELTQRRMVRTLDEEAAKDEEGKENPDE
jgi:hypothetical protein